MIDGGIIEGSVALAVALFGAIFIFGQVKSNAERNASDIEVIKTMMKEFQEDMKKMMVKNMEDMRQLIELNKLHQKESVEKEIAHLKDLISLTNSETRADIQRLQNEQRESNNLKAKILLMQSSLKALHHRLDIDPPIIIEDDN